jgi:hypothetical protein
VSISLALRMVGIHLDHARRLLDGHGLSDLERTLRKAEALRDRRQAAGLKTTARDIISGVREIATASQATAIIAMMR